MNQANQEQTEDLKVKDLKAPDANLKIQSAKATKYDSTDGEKLEGQEKDIQEEASHLINETYQTIGITGNQTQKAQQTGLIVLAIEFAMSAYIGLFFKSFPLFSWLLLWIPMLDIFCISLFITTVFLVQCCTSFVAKRRTNMLIFLLHGCSRIILLVYFSLWVKNLRLELSYMCIVFMIFWVLFEVRGHQDVDMTVRGNFIKIAVVGSVISLFFVMITLADIFVLILLPTISIGYIFVMLLSIQRFKCHEYLEKEKNFVYLSAAQVDADFVLFCPLIWYHLFTKKDIQQQPEQQESGIKNV